MEKRKSPHLYMIAHTIDLSNRDGASKRGRKSTQIEFESRTEPTVNYRGPERRGSDEATSATVHEEDQFITVQWQPIGRPLATARLPKSKLAVLESELAAKNTSTLTRLISNSKFRAGDRPALVLLLQQRGHQVLGEFVVCAKGAATQQAAKGAVETATPERRAA